MPLPKPNIVVQQVLPLFHGPRRSICSKTAHFSILAGLAKGRTVKIEHSQADGDSSKDQTGPRASDEQPVAWHVFQRREYQKRRYARHLSQPELDQRIRDIALNFLRLTKEAKIGLQPINEESIVWLEKGTHMMEEMRLRFGPYPLGFSSETFDPNPIPALVSALAQKGCDEDVVAGIRKRRCVPKIRKAKVYGLSL